MYALLPWLEALIMQENNSYHLISYSLKKNSLLYEKAYQFAIRVVNAYKYLIKMLFAILKTTRIDI